MLRSKKIWLFTTVLLCLACVMLLHWSQGRAQQNAVLQQQLAYQQFVQSDALPYLARVAGAPQSPKLSEYWVGIDGTPVDDVLRAQLELTAGGGIVVNQVVADGPAARAGLRQYDVLLAADERPLAQIGDLADYVQLKKEAAFTLRLVRAGKALTIDVTSQRRPATQTGETCPHVSHADDATFARQVYLDLLGQLPTSEQTASFVNDHRDDKRTRLANDLLRRSTAATKSCTACHAGYPVIEDALLYLGRQIGADTHSMDRYVIKTTDIDNDGQLDVIVAQAPLALSVNAPATLPDDLTITVTHTGNAPARIEVRRGDQSWGTIDTKLDELPADIRGYVRQFVVPTTRAVTVQPAPAHRARVSVQPFTSQRRYDVHQFTAPAADQPATDKPSESTAQTTPAGAALEQVDKQLKSLTQELEQLRKVIDDLRKSQPSQPTKPDGEQKE